MKKNEDIEMVGNKVKKVIEVDLNREVVRGLKEGNNEKKCGIEEERWEEKGEELKILKGEVEIMEESIGEEDIFKVFDIKKRNEC